MTDKPTIASTALGLAEVSRDLLTYAARDARDLANAARQLVGHVLLEIDPVGNAMTIATAADELAFRIEGMVGKVAPSLGELVALESADQPRH